MTNVHSAHGRLACAILLLGALTFAGCHKAGEENGGASSTGTATTGTNTTSGPSTTANNPPGPSADTSAGSTAANTENKAKEAASATGQKAQDMGTTAKVKNGLMTTKMKLDWKGINVDTANGQVTLNGSVPDAQQKATAETIAKNAAGTHYTIVNNLKVGKGG